VAKATEHAIGGSLLVIQIPKQLWMSLPELLAHSLSKIKPASFGVVRASRLLVQMALSFDVAVLQAIGPGTDLPRARLGHRNEI